MTHLVLTSTNFRDIHTNYEKKVQPVMANNSTIISTKWTITSNPKFAGGKKKTMTHNVGNPGLGLGQTQKGGMVKPVNEIPTNSPVDCF